MLSTYKSRLSGKTKRLQEQLNEAQQSKEQYHTMIKTAQDEKGNLSGKMQVLASKLKKVRTAVKLTNRQLMRTRNLSRTLPTLVTIVITNYKTKDLQMQRSFKTINLLNHL